MKRQPKSLFVLIMLICLASLGYWWGYSRDKKTPAAPKPAELSQGERLLAQNYAPDFTIIDLDGKEVTSDSLKGKVVLLHFWATWCHYCRKEIPHLNDIYREFAGDKVAILAVSLDRNGPQAVRTLMKKIKINYPVAMGNRRIRADFGNIRGLPTTFVINPQWQVSRVHRGYVPKSVLEKSIQELLKKKG